MQEVAAARSVRSSVLARMDQLSSGERKVARALLSAYPAAGLTTVADLAVAAGVSAPTVVRFATRVGYSGYPALQRDLVHEVDEGMGSPLSKPLSTEEWSDGASVLQRSADAFSTALAGSFAEVPQSEFDSLVALLADLSRQIRIVGGRFSRVIADYLTTHLTMLRDDVHLLPSDEVARLGAIADAGARTVLVVYDFRRYSDATVALAADLHDRGATIALVTDRWLSPIARMAEVVIPVRVESPSPWDSVVPAIAVTEAVIAAVTAALGETGRERLELIEATRSTATRATEKPAEWI